MKTMKNMIWLLGFVGILFALRDSTTPMQMPNLRRGHLATIDVRRSRALFFCKCSNDEYAPRFNNSKMTSGRRAFLTQSEQVCPA